MAAPTTVAALTTVAAPAPPPPTVAAAAPPPPALDTPVGAWLELYNECCATVDGHRPVDFLLAQLDADRVDLHFKHLLQFHAQTPGSNSRIEVQSGLVKFPEGDFTVDRSFIPQVLAFADALQIDEKFAFALFQTAIIKYSQVEYSGMQISVVAEYLYYEERKFQLELLCTLLKFAGIPTEASSAQKGIRNYFTQYVNPEALCVHLIDTLTKHGERIRAPIMTNNNSNTNSTTSATNARTANALTDEMTLLANALFYAMNAFAISVVVIEKCLDYLLLVTTRLRQQPLEEQVDFFLEAPETVYDPVLYHVASMVFTAIIRRSFLTEDLLLHDTSPAASLLPAGYSLVCSISADDLLRLNSRIIQFLNSYQPVSFHCGILFAHVMCLDGNASKILSQIASALIGNDKAVDTAVTALSEDVMFFMAQLLSMKPQKSGYNIISDFGGPLCYHTAKPRAFFALFRFWAAVFKASPKCGALFWTEIATQPNISYLLWQHLHCTFDYVRITLNTGVEKLISHEKFGEKIWLNFLELLAHSVGSPNTAFQAYQFIEKLRMNWQVIFDSMKQYISDFNPNVYAPFAPNALSITNTASRHLSPADIRYWINICQLMASVLEHNETIRGLMSDQWQAINSLFQFLMCPIPVLLKAKIVSVLSAFAMSERLSVTVWDTLDQSDLVVHTAISGLTVGQQRRREGLVFELSSTESTQQEYPLTRAFLRLISELIKWPLPNTLGVGKRAPAAAGLQPYLFFVCNEVFVKFAARGYTNLSEMWSVASECLSIMFSLLDSYRYKEQDATDSYTEINGRSTLLPRPPAYLLIREISYGTEIFKKIVYIIEQGAAKLSYDTSSDRGYIQVFEKAVELSLQVLIRVFEHIESANLPFNLGQHLVAGVQSCAIHLAKLIGYKSQTKIPLLSVELLSCLTKTPCGLAMMFYTNEESAHFINAMTLQLKSNEAEYFTGEDFPSLDSNQDGREGSLKLVIARFLLENITRMKPNISQFYLGLISDFETPVLADNACITAILEKLQDPEGFCAREPQLAESYYELLYKLCADPDFCEVTLEYLRDTKNDFFHSQLAQMPAVLPDNFVIATYEIYSKAWLMKLIAIEMYAMADNRTYISSLLDVMFFSESRADAHEMMISHKESTQRIILQHLTVLDVSQRELPVPHLQFFQSLTRYEAETQTINFRGVPCTDLRSLLDYLLAERSTRNLGGSNGVYSLAMAAATSLKTVDGEMFEILNYFRQSNLNENLLRGQVFFFAAWKQLVETIIYSASSYFTLELRTEIVTELLDNLLAWTTVSGGTPYISMMSSLVATLVSRLKLDKPTTVSLSDYEMNGKYTLPSGSMLKIFRHLLATLSRPGASRVLRGYIYAAIIDYLTITEVQPDTSSLLVSQANSNVRFLEDLANHYKRNKQDNYETLREFGFGYFLELIATDAAGTGVDPWRAVALALLDKILRYDDKTRSDIARFLDGRGFLRAFVDFESMGNNGSIVQILSSVGDAQPERLLYTGKVHFLIRLAQSPAGAILLRENFILEKIIHCKFIDYAPDNESNIRERYDLLLNPFLELCIAMLQQHRNNKEFVSEFVQFLDVHSEVLAQLIREKKFAVHHKLLSSIFYLLAGQQELLSLKLKTKQARFHAHLLQLLYAFKPTWAYSTEQPADIGIKLDILTNLLNYCVCFTTQGATSVIFAPAMKADSNNPLKEPIPTMSVLGYILSNAMAQHGSIVNDIAIFRQHTQRSGAIPEHILVELDSTLEVPEDITADQREIYILDTFYARIASKDALVAQIFSIIEATLLLIWHHLNFYLQPQKTPQQLYYQNYYQPTLPKNEGHTTIGGHTALQDSEITRLRDDCRAFLYSQRDANNLLAKVSGICVHKKASNLEVLLQKIKELLREPPQLVNR